MRSNESWDSVRDEVVAHLRHMIQIDTTNPPGNELPLARYIATALESEHIETRVLEPATGRGAVVARIRGTGKDRPVLLVAHMDVVAAEPEQWSAPPFAGEVRDGYLYGRGAIDDKGMLAANLMVMVLLKRAIAAGAQLPDRDVIFVATPDEEGPGEWGIGWLTDHHRGLLDAEFAINEGGRIRIVDGRPLYAAVQTAEKVSNVVMLTVHGTAGHAAVPLSDNPIARVARAVAAIAAHQEPVHLLPVTREFFKELSAVWPIAHEAAAMRDLVGTDVRRCEAGAAHLSRVPVFGAVLRTGISPTIITGGHVHNVIPESASATFSVRTLPGDALDDVLERLRALVSDEVVEITVLSRGTDAPSSDFYSPMFAAIRESINELDASIVTVPYLSTGATDSNHLRALGIQAFGLLPFPLDAADEIRMHAADERIPIASLLFGVRLLLGTVSRIIAGSGSAYLML